MGSLLGNIGGVIGLIVFLGAAVVYVRGSRDKGTIATLEASNRALSERVTVLEANEARMMAQIAALERENKGLLAQRPSAEAIAQISEDIDSLRVELHRHDLEVKSVSKVIKEWKR